MRIIDTIREYPEPAMTAGDTEFVSNTTGRPSISSTAYSISGLAEDTFHEIGPTQWTALNDVDDGSDWIEIKAIANTTGSGGIAIWVRKEGADDPGGIDETRVYQKSGSADNVHVDFFKVGISSTKKFDLQWSSAVTTMSKFDLYLTGFGKNP